MSLMSPRVTHFFQKPIPSPDHGITPLAALLFCMMNFGSLQVLRAEEAREPEQIIGDLGGMPISVSSSVVGRSGARYGTILARIAHVSGDAISDDKRGLIYAVRAKLAKTTIQLENRAVNLTAGMAVTVEIKTGKRRVIEYFLSPLMQYGTESLRER